MEQGIVLDQALDGGLALEHGAVGTSVADVGGIEALLAGLIVLLAVEELLVLPEELHHGMLEEPFIPALGVGDEGRLGWERHDCLRRRCLGSSAAGLVSWKDVAWVRCDDDRCDAGHRDAPGRSDAPFIPDCSPHVQIPLSPIDIRLEPSCTYL